MDTSGTWALAIDSTRGRILRTVPCDDPEPPAELVLRCEALRLRDIMTDKPGRSHAVPLDRRGSALDYRNALMAEDRRDFVRQVIAILDSHRRAGELDRLAVFAYPDMLDYLRQLMPPALRERVICEVPRNLLHLTPSGLRKTISREVLHGSEVSRSQGSRPASGTTA